MLMLLLILTGLALGSLAGCQEARVAAEERRVAEFQDRAQMADSTLAGIVQRYEQELAAGAERLEAAAAAMERLAAAQAAGSVPAPVVEAIGTAVAAGVPPGDAVVAARARLEAALTEAAHYRAELARDREAARAGDEAWFDLASVAVGLLPGGLFGAGTAVLAIGKRIRKGYMKGREEGKNEGVAEGIEAGAGAVRDSVAAGRAVDPAFDRLFAEDGPASRAMRATLDMTPAVAAIVRAHGRNKPRAPAGVR